MRLVCAMFVCEWHFELANVFALFRERSFQKDTIPKPGGLGSEGPLSGLYVPVLSHTCPTFVPVLSRCYSAPFRAPEGPWKTGFRMF